MWRYNAARQGATPAPLPEKLARHWSLELGAPLPAWPAEQQKLAFDRGYEPIVSGKLLIVPSMVDDSLSAYDTRTSELRWRFFANGPVRFAPCASGERVVFVSDDGYLYCLERATGKLLWKQRGGPVDRLALGNERLISAWPARGAPVVSDGIVYFAASIWPFMGIFVHAVELETGKILWTNSGTGSYYTMQQHGSPAFSGVAPQGYLAVVGDHLLVPGGRTTPALFRRSTGKLLWFDPSLRIVGKDLGGYEVTGLEQGFLNGGYAFSLPAGQLSAKASGRIIASGERLLSIEAERLVVRSRPQLPAAPGGGTLRFAWTTPPEIASQKVLRSPLAEPLGGIFLAAGSRAYGATKAGELVAFDLPTDESPVRWAWRAPLSETVTGMVAGDDRLFVITAAGAVHCFGSAEAAAPSAAAPATAPRAASEPGPRQSEIEPVLKNRPQPVGYCLLVGMPGENTLHDLARQTQYHVVVLESDSQKIAAGRAWRSETTSFRGRVAFLEGDLQTLQLPPYFASLVVVDNSQAKWLASTTGRAALWQCLHPYEGLLAFKTPGANSLVQAALVASDASGQAWPGKIEQAGDFTVLARTGGVAGAGEWTHHNGDCANTLVSNDRLVKLPLGLLWFGGPSHAGLLPRHGHGPSPLVVGGRVFMEGPNLIRATDAYTGRLLWERSLPGVGAFFDTKAHQPGAGGVGSNLVAASDSLYVVQGPKCLRLNAANGATQAEFLFPATSGDSQPATWGHLAVSGNLLIATGNLSTPLPVDSKSSPVRAISVAHSEASLELAAFDRHTGRLLWRRKAETEFRHNAIAVGNAGGRTLVFCLDATTAARRKLISPKAVSQPLPAGALLALDAPKGELVWRQNEGIAGTWLGYSPTHSVLVVGGSQSRDRARDEKGAGLAAFSGETGKPLWNTPESYAGPPLLHGNHIITQGEGYELLTGKRLQRPHPLSGQNTNWSWQRNYGCNTAIGSTHLLTFRSAAAGFYDLAAWGGTGNFGGFRSGCTNNLIPAGGLLNAPDYTRDCTCSYQNQCSLALVHMPELEYWTFSEAKWQGEPVERLGINFGAPGDRRAADGNLWLEYPKVGGISPEVAVRIRGVTAGKEPTYFCNFAWSETQAPLAWVAASGLRGEADIEISLATGVARRPRSYTVRAVLAAPARGANTPRKVTILLQGKPVLENFSIESDRASGATYVVREFRGVAAGETLTIGIRGAAAENPPELCGLEIIAERE